MWGWVKTSGTIGSVFKMDGNSTVEFDDFPINTRIFEDFSLPMFDYHRVKA